MTVFRFVEGWGEGVVTKTVAEEARGTVAKAGG